MRHLFSNQRNLHLSAGINDFKLAQRMEHDIVQRIYDKLDAARDNVAAKNHATTDACALGTIYGSAVEFRHKNISFLGTSNDK